ncbi:MAG: polyphosphate kinase 1 [Planctomycetota bacterium]
MGQQPPLVAPDGSKQYLNRELSLLAFHRRVLAQAEDESVPLLERLRFLTISSTNLDEFFEVRVGKLFQQVSLGVATPGPDGLSPLETLAQVDQAAHALVAEQYRVLNSVILPALEAEGVVVLRRDRWSAPQREWVQGYFEDNVLPVLTPVGLDPSHPFPQVLNKSLNFIVSLQGEDAFQREVNTAVVQVPRPVPRLIRLPPEAAFEGKDTFVLLSSVIHAHVDQLFPGMKILGCYQFRVTRNSDLWVDEEDVDDLLHALKGELPRRRYGMAVRLEMPRHSAPEVCRFLLDQFDLPPEALYLVDGPVNVHRLDTLCTQVDRPALKYRAFLPGRTRELANAADIFELLRRQDLLLHHPYQTFQPVLDLIRQAATDPNVLAIKQTLYRTGADSPVSEALLQAAQAGKEVTAVIELKARFDEARNIDLATQLQEAGAKVAYGIVSFKTHVKMLLIVRREGAELRQYAHLGTGNYHPGTARVYTDISLLTSDRKLCRDVQKMFQQLTGLGRVRDLKRLLQAPFTLHTTILELIGEEAKAAAKGKPARIVAKLNSLVEPAVIQALYDASQVGVEIDLIVRGICCLRPGVPGLSERIRVRSIVGRFLEHSRILWFHAGGEEKVYGSSADWMGRNFFRRIEAAFPIDDPAQKQTVIDALKVYLEDDCQAWELTAEGEYVRRAPTDPLEPRSAQRRLLAALAEQPAEASTSQTRTRTAKRKR